jgi:hypothetical protein
MAVAGSGNLEKFEHCKASTTQVSAMTQEMPMGEIRRIEPPIKTWRDRIDQAVTRGIDFYTGGFGSFVLDLIVPANLEDRKAAFYREVADGLNELFAQGRDDRAKLESHDQFISNYTAAVLEAIRTHEREKRTALRNAVLNTALGNAPDDTRQQIFMRWIDELTPLHLKCLTFFQGHRPHSGTLENTVVAQFPEAGGANLASVIVSDLESRHLIGAPQPGTVTYDPNNTRLTALGSAFLSFIRDPLEESS